MITRKVEIKPLMWLGLSVLVILLGLCTIVALVTTGAQAWQEHAKQRWPVVTTHVDKCDLQRSSTNGGRKVYIRCRLSYAVGTELNVTNIYSASVAAPEVWQYPRNQIAPLEEWLDANPQGTPFIVRCDPADHTKVVPVGEHTPFIARRTPNNLKLLAAGAGVFVVLLALARITWPRTFWQNRHSPVPLNP